MDFTKLYSIYDEDLKGALYIQPKNQFDHYKIFRGELELIFPIIFYPNIGKKAYDLVGSGYAGLNLFSSKIINMLKENKITGWKTYPCEIYDWDNNKLEGYSIFSVTGRCSAIDYSKSEKFIKQPYSPKGRPVNALRGLYFESGSWDESDIFTPEDSMFSIVTEKVKELFEENKITNIKFERITGIEIL